MAHIDGCGTYVPLYRIQRRTIGEQYERRLPPGEVAVPGGDENQITMGCEAAQNALADAGVAADDLDAVFVASTTDPFADHGIAAHIAYRVGATGNARTGDFRASARAAGDALATASAYLAGTSGSHALVVGTDAMPVEPGANDEPFSGAGAGAVVLTDEEPIASAAELVHVGQHTSGFVENHRTHGEQRVPGDQRYERTVGYTETVVPAVERGVDALEARPDRYTFQPFDHRADLSHELLADAVRDTTFDVVGYAGAATFFLDVARLLDAIDTGSPALAIAYGSGGADAFALEAGPWRPVDDDLTTLEAYLEAKQYVTYGEHLKKRQPVESTEVTI